MYSKSLSIGNLVFANNLIQGPLAGYSCAPFRRLFYHFQAPAYCCSEMISAQDLVQNKKSKKRFVFRDSLEKYLSYQLGGYEITYLKEAAQYLADLGADLIDINCGCPKPKIRKKRMGSYLLDHPYHVSKIIEAIKGVISVPLTVKVRLIKPEGEKNKNLEMVKMLTDAGADAIIVHGRHWSEDYNVSCHLDNIAEMTASTKIPIIGNGDINDLDSWKKMLETTQCAGVMISRAGTGKPWLYEEILTKARGDNFNAPDLARVKSLFFEHIEKLCEIENETVALLESRKFLKYYFGKNINEENFTAYCRLNSVKHLVQCLDSSF